MVTDSAMVGLRGVVARPYSTRTSYSFVALKPAGSATVVVVSVAVSLMVFVVSLP